LQLPHASSEPNPIEVSASSQQVRVQVLIVLHLFQHLTAMDDDDDEGLFLAKRRPRRLNRLLPMRFRFNDVLPKPLPPLPPEQISDDICTNSTNISAPSQPQAVPSSFTSAEGVVSHIRRLLTTPRNAFGLWRRYNTDTIPSHDPEEHIQLCDVFDNLPCHSNIEATNSPNATSQGRNPFYPYPNESSFRLGEWYWTGGIQKSQESFSQLLKIVGNERFRPEDVRCARWKEIDRTLAVNDFDEDEIRDEDAEWLDDDAGW
jgi:hypothetical protein